MSIETISETIRIYDDTLTSYYRNLIGTLYGTLNSSLTIYSSGGDLTIYYDDASSSYNGNGYSAEANILGKT